MYVIDIDLLWVLSETLDFTEILLFFFCVVFSLHYIICFTPLHYMLKVLLTGKALYKQWRMKIFKFLIF